ncbi:MAG TPA: hypothetical protein VG125_01550 [Pirellulales bacterium]|jgi:hypothetical protein|nr:hypothetical protein [Pirellulales bacterium]
MSFTLSWVLAASFVVTPSFGRERLRDYGAALEATKEAERPLLIVIDRQPEWLAHVDPVSDRVQPVAPSLLKKYTLCHIDATTDYGKAVAKAFRTSKLPTTVIIDKTGSVQLVKKTGRLSSDALASMLSAYQDGERPMVSRPIVCRT